MLFNLSRSWIVSFPPLDGLNKEQTRDYSDHDFQVLVVHRQFLTTKQMDTNGALVRAGLKLMMIHQSVSPYIKYTSLILFEVIVEADVWICFGKLLDFWSISVTISVVFFSGWRTSCSFVKKSRRNQCRMCISTFERGLSQWFCMQDSNHEHHNIVGMWVEGKQHDMKEEHRIIASFNITFPRICQIEKSKTSSQRKLLRLILKQKFSNNVSCCCSINFERYNLKVPTKQKKDRCWPAITTELLRCQQILKLPSAN